MNEPTATSEAQDIRDAISSLYGELIKGLDARDPSVAVLFYKLETARELMEEIKKDISKLCQE